MLNTSMKVISFDNGKCELSDNCMFFWLSILPSLNHLASLISLLYVSFIESENGFDSLQRKL